MLNDGDAGGELGRQSGKIALRAGGPQADAPTPTTGHLARHGALTTSGSSLNVGGAGARAGHMSSSELADLITEQLLFLKLPATAPFSRTSSAPRRVASKARDFLFRSGWEVMTTIGNGWVAMIVSIVERSPCPGHPDVERHQVEA